MTEKMSVTAFRQAQRDAWSEQEFTGNADPADEQEKE